VEDLFDLGVEFGDFVGMDFGYVLWVGSESNFSHDLGIGMSR
jgi:hypothetical protein